MRDSHPPSEPDFSRSERLENYRSGTMIDVLDRVLDKGIVIDGSWRFYFSGLYFMTIDTRVIVASIDTYLRYAPVLARSPQRPFLDSSLPTSAVEAPPAKKSGRQRR
jgi:gas vesicle protein GvpA/GvpJ/GvpM family